MVRAEKFPQRRFRQLRPLRQDREAGAGRRQHRKFVALLLHHMTGAADATGEFRRL